MGVSQLLFGMKWFGMKEVFLAYYLLLTTYYSPAIAFVSVEFASVVANSGRL